MTTSVSTTPGSGARNPSGIDTTTSSVPCTSRTTTSRSTRPSSSAVRLAGVTRWLSTTPARYSAISPKPTNSAPKIPSCTRIPGTKTW
jgi:hypothetical protein